MRERFRDSAGVLADYEFEINHAEEDAEERSINVERTAPTSGMGFVRQQGEPSPRVLRYQGSILTTAQYEAMGAYVAACKTRTIFFRDVDGTEYEVLVTNFAPQRKRVAWNSREPNLLWKWDYRLEMEVIS